MLEPPPTRILDRRETAALLLERRPDLSADRTQRRRARELGDALGNRRGAIDVLAAWLEGTPDADVRDLATALTDRVQLRLASLPARERGEAAVVAARVEEAFGLGWERLPPGPVTEALALLAEAYGGPAPESILVDAAGADEAQLALLKRSGFVVADDEGLCLDGATLGFLRGRPHTPADRVDRALRLAQAVRERAARLPPDAPSLDGLAWRARDLCQRLEQPGLVASLAHRMAEAQRARGDLDGARAWIEEGQAAARGLGAAGRALLGLLQLDAAHVALEAVGSTAARPHAARAIELLDTAQREGIDGAERAALRARLLLLQIDASNRADAPESALLEVADRLAEGSPDDALARAVALQTLGSALLRRGERAAGRQRLAEARALFEQAGNADARRLTALLVADAQGHHGLADPRAAEELLERARVLGGGDMDRPPDRALPLALHELGLAAADRGDRGAAATLLDEAAMLAGSMLPPGDPARATTAYSRGLLFLADGEHRRAEKNLEKAREGWRAAYPHENPAHAIGRAASAWARARGGDLDLDAAEQEVAASVASLASGVGLDAGWLAQLHALRADLAAMSARLRNA